MSFDQALCLRSPLFRLQRPFEVQTLPFSPPGKSVAKLDSAQRARLRDLLRETLPVASGGSITYSTTALAGKGQKP